MHKYLKLFTVTIFSLLIVLSSDAFAQYKPGTYKGSAMGRSDKKHSGEIEVEVKVNEKGIEAIKVLKYEQSVDHKKYGKDVVKAQNEVPANMTKKNSVDVDVVSGATMSSIGLNLAVAKALEKASLNKYKAGTYKGASVGRSDKKHSGEIEVEVTVSDKAITDIKVTKYEQSVDHKKYGKDVVKAQNEVPANMTKKNSVDVDVVSGATMSSVGLNLAVAKALEKASLNKYKAGTYKGASVGRSDKKHSGEIEVEVTVSDKAITDIKVTKYEQSVDHKKYGKPVTEAQEKIPAAVVKGQSIDVDVISDATMSSSGIQLAVAKALEKARVK